MAATKFSALDSDTKKLRSRDVCPQAQQQRAMQIATQRAMRGGSAHDHAADAFSYATQHLTKPCSEFSDATTPQQLEKTMNAQAPELNDVAFETVDFIFGQEASKLTESQLFAAVTKTQAKIKSLKDLNIKSEHVTTQIEKLNDGLNLIVKTIDALSE